MDIKHELQKTKAIIKICWFLVSIGILLLTYLVGYFSGYNLYFIK